MSEVIKGTVTQVLMDGPLVVKKEGKNQGKTFHIHKVLVTGELSNGDLVDNLELSKFDFRQEPQAPCEVGDDVQSVFSSIKSGNKTVNSIQELTVNGQAAPKQQAPTGPKNFPKPKFQPSAHTSSPKVEAKSNDFGKGARVGGILHDAVAIAIHNSLLEKNAVNLEEVEEIAKSLLTLAAKLDT